MTLAPVAIYASSKLHAAVAPSAGGKIIDAYVYNDPGDAEYFANLLMHSATSKIAAVASTYASHVPFPASAHTNGIVAAGVVVGAIVDTDCASVSIGDSTPVRSPYPAASPCPCSAISIDLRSYELFRTLARCATSSNAPPGVAYQNFDAAKRNPLCNVSGPPCSVLCALCVRSFLSHHAYPNSCYNAFNE